jgi:hypothetical protein
MTELEIMDLIQHRKDTNTYHGQCGEYGFHGTDLFKVAKQLSALICLMPGCSKKRCEVDGRQSYLCDEHFEEACKEEAEHAAVATSGSLSVEPEWYEEASNFVDIDNGLSKLKNHKA